MARLVILLVVLLVAMIVAAVIVAVLRVAGRAAAPVRQEAAIVIGQRVELSGGGDAPIAQTHYATFEFGDGSRVELKVAANQAGLLAAGDRGQLTWRADLLLSFQRELWR
jgi:hypothetical protein